MATASEEPVYPVAGKLHSLHDLLAIFTDPAHMIDGISRFSDLHLKTGEAAHYRYDGDITGAWHQLYSQIETGTRDGMITLERHLLSLARAGEISIEEARLNANDPQVIDHLLTAQ